eukprot:TRINITY_DN11490_c0_g1_i1.p1 TRINITY_DN11490_c0_g1~~TRINITY_DN11490_c0_g1_i1.p1  ORF type:complete len:502 (+),score=99.00 TRINITY_DN11490_c0_g1_i1:53-1558(+)
MDQALPNIVRDYLQQAGYHQTLQQFQLEAGSILTTTTLPSLDTLYRVYNDERAKAARRDAELQATDMKPLSDLLINMHKLLDLLGDQHGLRTKRTFKDGYTVQRPNKAKRDSKTAQSQASPGSKKRKSRKPKSTKQRVTDIMNRFVSGTGSEDSLDKTESLLDTLTSGLDFDLSSSLSTIELPMLSVPVSLSSASSTSKLVSTIPSATITSTSARVAMPTATVSVDSAVTSTSSLSAGLVATSNTATSSSNTTGNQTSAALSSAASFAGRNTVLVNATAGANHGQGPRSRTREDHTSTLGVGENHESTIRARTSSPQPEVDSWLQQTIPTAVAPRKVQNDLESYDGPAQGNAMTMYPSESALRHSSAAKDLLKTRSEQSTAKADEPSTCLAAHDQSTSTSVSLAAPAAIPSTNTYGDKPSTAQRSELRPRTQSTSSRELGHVDGQQIVSSLPRSKAGSEATAIVNNEELFLEDSDDDDSDDVIEINADFDVAEALKQAHSA